MKLYPVKLKILARRFLPGTVRVEEFEFLDEVEAEINNVFSLIVACRREFGLCKSRAYNNQGDHIGWRFEGREKGTNFWWETLVVPVEGFRKVYELKL